MSSQSPAPAQTGRGLLGDGFWTLLTKIASQGLQLAVFIMAARMLQPAAFGLFAFCTALAILMVVLAEGGWREYVLGTPDAAARHDETATIALISGGALTALGLICAVALWRSFALQDEALLIAFYCLWIVPAVMSAFYEGVMVAQGQVRIMAKIRIAAEVFGAVLALGGLWAGYGVFALVAGRIAMQLGFLGGALLATRYLPRLRFDLDFTRVLFAFSGYILINRLAVQLRSYSGTLIVGMYLGLGDAGLFRAAERLVAAIGELVGEPARMMGWIFFRRLGPVQGAKWRAEVTRYMAALICVAALVFGGMALIAQDLVRMLLGENWLPAASIVPLLALKQLLVTPSMLTEPLLSIAGAIRRAWPAVLANAAVAVGALALAAPYGIMPAAGAQIASACFALGTTVFLQRRYAGMMWPGVLRGIAALPLALLVMGATVLWIGRIDLIQQAPLPLMMLAKVLGGTLAYAATLFLCTQLAARFSARAGAHP
ncbi:MAG: oligosaccharide flippase family protein [Sulfitobacter sp.]